MTRWATFFDRDGVLTEVVTRRGVAASARSPAELVLSRDARHAVDAVHAVGGLAIVVSNQPDVARRLLVPADLDEMNRHLSDALGVDDILVCPHDGVEQCPCRKPEPGMLLDAAGRHGLDLGQSWTIGDRWVDIAAGAAAGTATILLVRAYSWESTSTGEPPVDLAPTWSTDTLEEAVAAIVCAVRRRPTSF